MPKQIDFSEVLSTEIIIDNVAPYLDPASLIQLQSVSNAYNSLFNDPMIWKKKICHKFKIKTAELHHLEKVFGEIKYKPLYFRLTRLQKKLSSKPNRLRYFLDAPGNVVLAIAICIDASQFLFSNQCDKHHHAATLEFMLHAGNPKTTAQFFQLMINRLSTLQHIEGIITPQEAHEYFFEQAIKVGNKQIIAWLLDDGQEIKITINATHLQIAGYNKNIMAYLYLRKFVNVTANESEIIDLLNAVLLSGSMDLYEQLRQRHELPFQISYLENAAKSGNLELFKAVLAWAGTQDVINNTILINAITFCSVPIVNYLLENLDTFHLTIDDAVLSALTETTNSELFFKVLEKSNFKISLEMFRRILRGGNIELVEFCLRTNNFIIATTELHAVFVSGNLGLLKMLFDRDSSLKNLVEMRSVQTAINFGYQDIVDYFLDPNSQFFLQVETAHFNSAKRIEKLGYMQTYIFAVKQCQFAIAALQLGLYERAEFSLATAYKYAPDYTFKLIEALVENKFLDMNHSEVINFIRQLPILHASIYPKTQALASVEIKEDVSMGSLTPRKS